MIEWHWETLDIKTPTQKATKAKHEKNQQHCQPL